MAGLPRNTENACDGDDGRAFVPEPGTTMERSPSFCPKKCVKRNLFPSGPSRVHEWAQGTERRGSRRVWGSPDLAFVPCSPCRPLPAGCAALPLPPAGQSHRCDLVTCPLPLQGKLCIRIISLCGANLSPGILTLANDWSKAFAVLQSYTPLRSGRVTFSELNC